MQGTELVVGAELREGDVIITSSSIANRSGTYATVYSLTGGNLFYKDCSLSVLSDSKFQRLLRDPEWSPTSNEKPWMFLRGSEREKLHTFSKKHGFLLRLSKRGAWDKVTTFGWSNPNESAIFRTAEVREVETLLYVGKTGTVSSMISPGCKIIKVSVETTNGALAPGNVKIKLK